LVTSIKKKKQKIRSSQESRKSHEMSNNPPTGHQPWIPSLHPLSEDKDGSAAPGPTRSSKNSHAEPREEGDETQPFSSSPPVYWDQDSKLVRSLKARVIQEDWIIEDARRMEDREREDERRKEDRERKLAQLQAESRAQRKRDKAEFAQAKQDHEREEARRGEDRKRQDERQRENRQLAKDRHTEEHWQVHQTL